MTLVHKSLNKSIKYAEGILSFELRFKLLFESVYNSKHFGIIACFTMIFIIAISIIIYFTFESKQECRQDMVCR